MPTRFETTSSPLGYTIATMQAVVTSLYAAIQSGAQINAAPINSWKTGGYDIWRTHSHSATDLQGIDNFGNVGLYGPGGVYYTQFSGGALQTNGVPMPAVGAIPGIAPGNQITASDINAMIAIANNMRAHYHTMSDITV